MTYKTWKWVERTRAYDEWVNFNCKVTFNEVLLGHDMARLEFEVVKREQCLIADLVLIKILTSSA